MRAAEQSCSHTKSSGGQLLCLPDSGVPTVKMTNASFAASSNGEHDKQDWYAEQTTLLSS